MFSIETCLIIGHVHGPFEWKGGPTKAYNFCQPITNSYSIKHLISFNYYN